MYIHCIDTSTHNHVVFVQFSSSPYMQYANFENNIYLILSLFLEYHNTLNISLLSLPPCYLLVTCIYV